MEMGQHLSKLVLLVSLTECPRHRREAVRASSRVGILLTSVFRPWPALRRIDRR